MQTMSDYFVLSLVLTSLLFALVMRLLFLRDTRVWNSGICLKSKLPWIQHAKDSWGTRGYTDGKGTYCWIYFNVDCIHGKLK